jgi:HK97 gp10 family phage protein
VKINLRALSIACAVCIGMLGAILLANPADLGISPVAARWLGIVATGLGILQSFLPRTQGRIISNRLPQVPGMVKAALSAEVSKAAYAVQAQAQAKAPVLTGTLRRSIHTVIEQGGQRAVVGPNVPYDKIAEFGGRNRAPHPYMRPAAEAVLPQFVASVRAALAGLR